MSSGIRLVAAVHAADALVVVGDSVVTSIDVIFFFAPSSDGGMAEEFLGGAPSSHATLGSKSSCVEHRMI
jgi:hypothetical protein